MRTGKKQTLAIAVALIIALPFGARQIWGRNRPDFAALLSWDDGTPLTFARTYRTGAVGPFSVGESRETVRARLLGFEMLDQDRVQLSKPTSTWRIALPAKAGGYIIYTIAFDGDHVVSVRPFYSLLAGL